MLSVKHPNGLFTINVNDDECRVAIRWTDTNSNDNDEIFMWLKHGELNKLIFDLQEAKEEIELNSMRRDLQGGRLFPIGGPQPPPDVAPENVPAITRRCPTESSVIERFDWYPVTKILTIIFKTGSSYTYIEVPREVAEGFLHDDSPGTFYNENIKGQYRSEKN